MICYVSVMRNAFKTKRSSVAVFLLGIVILAAKSSSSAAIVTDNPQAHLPVVDHHSLTGYYFKGCCVQLTGMLNKIVNASTGQIQKTGVSVEMLEWMSTKFHFQYECQDSFVFTTVENTSTSVGGIHLLKTGICDMLVGPGVIRYDRFLQIDFSHPWLIEPTVLLMPLPISTFNLSAFWQPFHLYVWILVIFFTFATAIVFVLLDLSKSGNPEEDGLRSRLDVHWLSVIGNLLSKAAQYMPKKLKFRFLAGAWCLATFVLGAYYTSILTSLITAPYYKPLVDSVAGLAAQKDVGLVVVKGTAPDVAISTSLDPVYKQLNQKLQSYPNSRCTINLTDCVEQVKKGPAVFINLQSQIIAAMAKDFRQTHRCNLALAKGIFDSYLESWGLPKEMNRHIVESLNIGILRMQEVGLITKWLEQYQNKPKQCFDREKERLEEELRNPTRLGLGNMTGMFAILLIGFLLSWLVLIIEKTYTCVVAINNHQ